MITQLIGRLVEKTPTTLVIDCNGIGYEVHISLHTFSQIRDEEKIKLYTHHQIREDAHTLFGFHSLLERSIFRLLLSVSGIGEATARSMLSSLAPQEIHAAIVNEDLATIKGIPSPAFLNAIAAFKVSSSSPSAKTTFFWFFLI